MSENIKLQNNVLTLVVSSLGAEIKSLVKNSEEYIWCGDPNVWSGQAPLLFPICGGLKNDKYVYEGKEYTLEKHGFARNSEFETEKVSADSVTFLLRSNEETFAAFPFDFELRVTYTLNENILEVSYSVTNTGSKKMYFSIGAHEGYACRGGIENYSIIFEHTENLKRIILDGNLLSYDVEDILDNTNALPLKNEYFLTDAIVFSDLKSKETILKDNRNGKEISVKFDGFDYLLVWTKPGAEYICIEPWCGIPDRTDSDGDITHKQGIIAVNAGDVFSRTHSISL